MKSVNWIRPRGRAGASRATLVVGAALALVVAAFTVFAVVGQADATSSVRLESVMRATPVPAGARALGRAKASVAQHGFVVLKPRDNAALKSFITAVTDTHSASYHHYLAAGQFKSRFGPAAATIHAVKAQLKSDGLKVGAVSRNGLMIAFTGSTSRVQSAFKTRLGRYRTSSGLTGQLATAPIKLPSSIAPDVSSVVGLDNLVHPIAEVKRPPASAYANYPKAKSADISNHTKGAPNPASKTTAAACHAPDGGSAASAAAAEYGGLTDDQIANAYGATNEYSAGDFGQGVHIGLYELEPFALSDVQTFDTCYYGDAQAAIMSGAGTSGSGDLTVKPVDGGQPIGPGEGEAVLDVEDVSGIAPAANIDVYEGGNTTASALDVYAQMVDDDTDQIISSSWGWCEQDEQLYAPGQQEAENYIFEQAAAQGQTVLNATGDTGDDGCNEAESTIPPPDQNPVSTDDTASQPYVMAVGGTTLQDANPAHYNETTWNDGAYWGSGNGGISQSWAMPSWQRDSAVPGLTEAEPGGIDWDNANYVEQNAKGLGISDQNWPADFCQSSVSGASSSTPCRALPDVSADADEFTGAITIYTSQCETGGVASTGWCTEGGTSSSSPIWAGILALVDESSQCASIAPSSGKVGLGFVVPMLYQLASDPAEYAQSFHDITSGTNDSFGFDAGKIFPARRGFDLATGLGSPILTSPSGGAGLAADLCALATSSTVRPAVTSLEPSAGSVAGTNTVTVDGSGFESGGVADVGSVQVGGATVPSSDVTVISATSLQLTMPTGASAAAPPSSERTDPSTGITFIGGGSTQNQDGSGPAQVVVTTTGGASSATGPNATYDFVDESTANPGDAIPMVSSVGPYAAPQASPGEVTVYGSDFDNTDTVTVGGLPATVDAVVSPFELKVTPPAYSPTQTTCATAAQITTETGDSDPSDNDICQTQVIVTNDNGSSNTSTIYPTYEGAALVTDPDGLDEVPAGFEISAQPTEFDYVPVPTITAVSTVSGDPSSLASDKGGTVIRITGTGLNYQTLNWFAIGTPSEYSSEDYSVSYTSGTAVDITVPASPDVAAGAAQTEPAVVPVYADTLGDATDPQDSASGNLIYAGIPVVSSVAVGATTLKPKGNTDKALGLPVAPATGGSGANAALSIHGSGFSDATAPLMFVDAADGYSNLTAYGFTAASDSEIDGQLPSSNAAVDDVRVCTVSGCSARSSRAKTHPNADLVLFYPPGAPKIDSISSSSGPASGGRTVTIHGQNLGCTTSVRFGGKAALAIIPTQALLDCGSTSSVSVIAPAGKLGKSVSITLGTVETDATGERTATSPTKFKYTANPALSASRLKFGSATVGKAGSVKTVTLRNPAGAPRLVIGTAAIVAQSKPAFTIAGGDCSHRSLTAGKSCHVKLRFKPKKLGAANATLVIPFDQSLRPLRVTLAGRGER